MDIFDMLCDQGRANHLLGLDDDDMEGDDDEFDDFDEFDDDESEFSGGEDDDDDDDSETNTNTNTNTNTFTYGSSSTNSYYAAAAGLDPVVPEQHTFQKTTRLFEAIESQYWSTTMNFLTTGRWAKSHSFLVGSSSKQDTNPVKVSPKEEARTWAVTLDKSGKVTTRRLPLHAALMHKAPLKLVKALVDLYPGATECVDSKGNLPLHLAYQYKAANPIVTLLLQVYPEADEAKNGRGCIPCESGDEGNTTRMIPLKPASALNTSIDSGSKIAQIAAKITKSSKAKQRPTIDNTDSDLDDLKKELADLRRGKGSSNTTTVNLDAQEQESEPMNGWMQSIHNLQDILGIQKQPKNETNITNLLPPLEELASRDEYDDKDSERPSLGGRWKKSFRRRSFSRDGKEDDGASMEEQSVEVNFASRSVSSNHSKSSNKKRFALGKNPFRKTKTAPQQNEKDYMETVTVHSATSRDSQRPKNSDSFFSIGGIQQTMEALNMGNMNAKTTEQRQTRTKSPARRLFGGNQSEEKNASLPNRSPRGRSRSRSPGRFSRHLAGNASSDKSTKSSSTPKRRNGTKSPARFFRKRSYGWLSKNNNADTKKDTKDYSESHDIQTKPKKAKGESMESGSSLGEGGVFSSVFSWDLMNGAMSGTSNTANRPQTEDTNHTSWGIPRTRSPYNPSFLENSLLVSSTAATKQKKEQRGGSSSKHFLVNNSFDDDEDPQETMDTNSEDDEYSCSSREDDGDFDDSFGTHSRGTYSSGDFSEEDILGVDHHHANEKGSSPGLGRRLFGKDDNKSLQTIFSDQSMKATATTDDVQLATTSTSATVSTLQLQEGRRGLLKNLSSHDSKSSSNDNKKQSHRRMRSLGSLVAKSKAGKMHRRKASLGSMGNKSEGHNRKASFGSIGGFLRGKKSRSKQHANDAVFTSTTSGADALPSVKTLPEKPDTAYLTMQLQQKAVEAMRRAQSSKLRDTTATTTVDNHNKFQHDKHSTQQMNASILLPRKADWRSDYRAYLSTAGSGASNDTAALVGVSGKQANASSSPKRRSSIQNKQSTRSATGTRPRGVDEILEDLEQFPPPPPPSSCLHSLLDRKDSFESNNNNVAATSTPKRGPVVSESTVENSDSGNVYLVRVQF